MLQHEDGEQRHQADGGEGQQRQAVGLPVLFALRVDPGNAVAQSLHRLQHGAQQVALALHGIEEETPEERCRRQHQYEEGQDQPIVLDLHGAS
ncbi:hypothetical protein D9M68_979220 [compost metagenome]